MAKVTSIQSAPKATNKQTTENNALIAETLSQDMLDTYDRILKAIHQVQINQAMIENVYTQ